MKKEALFGKFLEDERMNETMFSELLRATQAFESENLAEVTDILRRVVTEQRELISKLPEDVAEDLEEALLALENHDPVNAGRLGEQALVVLGALLPSHVSHGLIEAARAVSHENYAYAAITLRSVIRYYHPHLTLAATA